MFTYISLLSGFIVAVAFGIVVIPNILLISRKKRLYDIPNERKVHSVPTTRLGGLSFFPIILMSMCLVIGLRYTFDLPSESIPPSSVLHEFVFFAVGCMLLYLVGVMDDLIGLGYRYKLVIQMLAALLVVLSGIWINSLGGLFGIHYIPAFLGIPLTVFVVVYITNAINMIDGIDGLASGLCSIAFTVLGIRYIQSEEYVYALLAFSALGVLIPFWYYNVFGCGKHNHKVFMGDTGSLTLGFILSFLIIHMSFVNPQEYNRGESEIIIAFSTLLIPISDVARVIVYRLRKGKSPFMPDTNHFHHKLLRMGMEARRAMAALLLASMFFVGINIVLVNTVDTTWLLLINLFFWISMHLYINKQIRKKKNKVVAR